MKVGDLVTTDDSSRGPMGIVVQFAAGMPLTTVRVLIEGEIEAFDSRTLWSVYESR